MPESRYLWSGIQSSSPDRPGSKVWGKQGKASEAEHLFEKYLICHASHTNQSPALHWLPPSSNKCLSPRLAGTSPPTPFFQGSQLQDPKWLAPGGGKLKQERSKCLLIFSSRFIVHTIDDHAIFLPSLTSQPSKRILLDRKRERVLKGSSRVWHFVFGKDQPC